MLPELARRFFVRGRKVAREKASPEDLHRLRLSAKQFRYTLELFRPVYGPGLERRLENLRTVQQKLGDANDCATARELLLAGRDRKTRPAKAAVAFIESKAAALQEDFRTYWRGTFDAPGEERGWAGYLERFAGRGRYRR
jgi:CHAD domain-containing protein